MKSYLWRQASREDNDPDDKEYQSPPDDIMTLKEFDDSVKCGAFIDDDGYGHLITLNSEGKVDKKGQVVYPSEWNRLDKTGWTHVIWYNK